MFLIWSKSKKPQGKVYAQDQPELVYVLSKSAACWLNASVKVLQEFVPSGSWFKSQQSLLYSTDDLNVIQLSRIVTNSCNPSKGALV